MAGLIITEAYAEAKDKNEPLIMQTLDAEKAFDVVWHDSLLRKLYKDGVRGDLWLLVKSLHTDSHTIVKSGPYIPRGFESRDFSLKSRALFCLLF